MTTRTFRVYGAEGHRQKISFGASMKFKTWSGAFIEVDCEDKTGTNDYVIIRITAASAEACARELQGQITDGIFENVRTGEIVEIK